MLFYEDYQTLFEELALKGKELGRIYFKCFGDFVESPDGWVSLASFYHANIRSMQ